jgi:hypothetical protein
MLPARFPRHAAPLMLVLMLVTALPPAARAGAARCGAEPVHGRDGSVLYWTGGVGCIPASAASDGGSPRQDAGNAPVVDLTPEPRPAAEAEVAAG